MNTFLDDDGYPFEEDLIKIETWKAKFSDLMDFVEDRWQYSEMAWKQEGNRYEISTMGWSGNEEIIGALMRNNIFWLFCWVQSTRGGHYIFEMVQESK